MLPGIQSNENIKNSRLNQSTDIKIYYQNVRGMRTKISEVYHSIQAESYEIIALTETWLNESFNSKEMFTDYYQVFRSDN